MEFEEPVQFGMQFQLPNRSTGVAPAQKRLALREAYATYPNRLAGLAIIARTRQSIVDLLPNCH